MHNKLLNCKECGATLDLHRKRISQEACPEYPNAESIYVAPCSACGREHCTLCGALLDTDVFELARQWR